MPRRSRPRTSLRSRVIPDCEGKHAAKFFDETLAIFQVEMKDNLRVRRGAEGMAALFEFGAQFARRYMFRRCR